MEYNEKSKHYDDSLSDAMSLEQQSNFVEYFDSSYELDGSHAAPMLLTGDSDDPLLEILQNRQKNLVDRLTLLSHAELDERIGFDSAEFVARSIQNRMHQREGQNSMSYLRRRHKVIPNLLSRQHLPLSIIRAIESSKLGVSTPLQAHMARHALGMESAELANLTRIGDARKEFREPMHEQIQELVGHDVDFGKDSVYRASFTGTDLTMDGHKLGSASPKFMRLEFKSRITELDDGTKIRDRMSAVIDTREPSVFDQDAIAHFHEVFAKEGPREVSKLSAFGKIAMDLVNGNIDPYFVIADNETIYEYNPKERDRQASWHRRRKLRNEVRTSQTNAIDVVSPFGKGDPRGIIIATNGESYSVQNKNLNNTK